MKARIILLTAAVCLAFLPVTFAQETATLRYDAGFDGTAAMPRSYAPDQEGGIERFPDPNLNFIIQYGMRFTPLEAGLLRNINFWVEEILTRGVADSTISYHRPQIAFDWPFPFNHVPQTFEQQAVRFTSPGSGLLTSIGLFPGNGFSSTDGFNDSLKISLLKPARGVVDTVRYGNENAANNYTIVFNMPVLSGANPVLSYGVRYTAPEGDDATRLSQVQFFVENLSSSPFLPAGDTPPNDDLRVRVYSVDSVTALPDELLAEKRIVMSAFTPQAWNTIDVFDLGIDVEPGEEVIVAYDLVVTGDPNHIGFASGGAVGEPRRSLILETGGWAYFPDSGRWGGNDIARNAELWMRAVFESLTTEAGNDSRSPDENAPLANAVVIPFNQFSPNEFNAIDVSSLGLSLDAGEDFWVTAEVIRVGDQDRFSFISDGAEAKPTYRSAAWVTGSGETGAWRFLQNTQFNSEYVYRMTASFSVGGQIVITDGLFVLLHQDEDGKPGSVINLKAVPMSGLDLQAWNTVDVADWGYELEEGRDFHVVLAGDFDQNEIAIGRDAGVTDPAEFRATAFYLNTNEWVKIGETGLFGGENNLMIEAEYSRATSVGREGVPLEFTLHNNYPNPFNPATTLAFDLPESSLVTLAVYDMLGRRVATLRNGESMPAGSHQVTWDASMMGSGMYIVRISNGANTRTQKVMLVK
ncbi:MAG: T9SS C-terminal target domain-containing protein [Balneolaceae bacterium]|nr:MAG: T9SS C-terminal target domain-containing protein [Balneolaceae bacterium]